MVHLEQFVVKDNFRNGERRRRVRLGALREGNKVLMPCVNIVPKARDYRQVGRRKATSQRVNIIITAD